MNQNIQSDLASEPVENTKTYSWTVHLYEHGGTLRGKWNSAEFEANQTHVVLYLDDKEHRRQHAGKQAGDIDFEIARGAGFRLALVAKDFDDKEIEIVTTALTQGTDKPMPPAVTTEHLFRVKLENEGGKAKLTWFSTAPFRPRQSQYQVYAEGNEKKWDWITKQRGDVITDVRWGVKLRAAYTAERYGTNLNPGRVEVVATPTTK